MDSTMSHNPQFAAKTISLLASAAEGAAPDVLHPKLILRRTELLQEIQAIDSIYNSVTWTCRLPNEILMRIFILARDQSLHLRQRDERLSWLSATRVCAHWRNVALSCASLWSTPDFSHHSIARMMLQRSKASVLDIVFNRPQYATSSSCTGPETEALSEVLSQVARLRSVKISLYNEVWQSLRPIFSDWNVPAIHLDELSIVVIGRPPENSKASEVFIPNGTPSLRRLTLVGTTISFETLVPLMGHNITHLCFEEKRPSARVRPASMKALLSALHKMPLLEDLSLSSYLPESTSNTAILPPLHIPRLTHLHAIDEDTAKLPDFLDLLRCPQLKSVSVNMSLHAYGSASEVPRHPFGPLREILDHPTNPLGRNEAFTNVNHMRLCFSGDQTSCALWFQVGDALKTPQCQGIQRHCARLMANLK